MKIDDTALTVIESLKKKELVIFCGAGVSCNSGMPPVNILTKNILTQIGVHSSMSHKHIDIIRKDIKSIIDSNYPFEAFIECLKNNSDVNYIFDIYSDSKIKPNNTHHFIASLCQNGYVKTVVTMNIDELIEKALDDLGTEYIAYHKDEEFKNIFSDPNNNKVRVIKLHGTVSDRENMGMTLSKVANKLGIIDREKVINEIFSLGGHKSILILGYSCSDIFDIVPIVKSIKEKKNKKIIFIEHNNTNDPLGDLEKSELELEQKQSIEGNSNSLQEEKLKLKNTKYDLTEKKRKFDNMFAQFEHSYIYDNTDNLIHNIQDDLSLTTIKNQWADNWKKFVTEYSEKGWGKFNSNGIFGSIFSNISQFDNAIKYHTLDLAIANGANFQDKRANCLNNLADVYHMRGHYNTSIKFSEEVLEICESITNREYRNKLKENSFGNLGNNYFSNGDLDKAIYYYKKASSFNKDKWGSMLNLTHNKLQNTVPSIKLSEENLESVRNSGDKEEEIRCLFKIAMECINLNEYQQAINYYLDALKIAKDIEKKKSQAGAIGGMGHAYFAFAKYNADQNKFEDAALFYNESILNYKIALDFSKEILDEENQGFWLGNLGNVYLSIGSYKEALASFQEALLVTQKINDKEGIASCYHGLGNYHYILKNNKEAFLFYKKSLALYKVIYKLQPEHQTIKAIEKSLKSIT